MTEKRFYIKCDEINAWSIWEIGKDVIVFDLHKSDAKIICDLLNELHEENKALKSDRARYEEECRLDVFKELSEENEQLKETNQELQVQLNLIRDQSNSFKRKVIEKNNSIGILKRENERLKKQNADWETSLDICKHYKETYANEIVHIKQTIKDMLENERTELGRSVLRQLWEAIQ